MAGAWEHRAVTVVAAFDSFLKSALPYARHLEASGARVRYRIVFARPNQISRRQLSDLGVPESRTRTLRMDALVTPRELGDEDVVLVALNGLRSRRFYLRFHRALREARRRPITASFYPGLIFRFHLEGMASRMAADLLLLNSPHDLTLYEGALASMGLENRNAIALGLSFLPTAEERAAHRVPEDGPILFAAQPTVPAGRGERRFVLEQLVSLARRHPETRWQLKPRHRREETTLHRVDHHFEDLLEELPFPPPANFEITHTPMAELIRCASSCLTFSSTAALEAACLGVPTRVLNDLGVHENLGNHFFIGSDMHASLDEIGPGLPFRGNPEWWSKHVRAAGDRLHELDTALLERLHRQDAMGTALGPPYPRLFGRAEGFESELEAREGWEAVARFGTRGTSRRARLQRALRPIDGAIRDLLARTRDRLKPSL